jgi:hypothetical protein
MKFIKELKEQYAYVWWWLLENGIIIATIVVNFLSAIIFAIVMGILYFFLKWFGKH